MGSTHSTIMTVYTLCAMCRVKLLCQCEDVFRSMQINKNAFIIALFTVDFSRLHYNVIQRGCEAISG